MTTILKFVCGLQMKVDSEKAKSIDGEKVKVIWCCGWHYLSDLCPDHCETGVDDYDMTL